MLRRIAEATERHDVPHSAKARRVIDCPGGTFPFTSAIARQDDEGLGLEDWRVTPALVPAVVETMAPPLNRNVLAGHCATADNKVPIEGLGAVVARGPVTSRLEPSLTVAPAAPVAPGGPTAPGGP